jgi:hypothetical protein
MRVPIIRDGMNRSLDGIGTDELQQEIWKLAVYFCVHKYYVLQCRPTRPLSSTPPFTPAKYTLLLHLSFSFLEVSMSPR